MLFTYPPSLLRSNVHKLHPGLLSYRIVAVMCPTMKDFEHNKLGSSGLWQTLVCDGKVGTAGWVFSTSKLCAQHVILKGRRWETGTCW